MKYYFFVHFSGVLGVTNSLLLSLCPPPLSKRLYFHIQHYIVPGPLIGYSYNFCNLQGFDEDRQSTMENFTCGKESTKAIYSNSKRLLISLTEKLSGYQLILASQNPRRADSATSRVAFLIEKISNLNIICFRDFGYDSKGH